MLVNFFSQKFFVLPKLIAVILKKEGLSKLGLRILNAMHVTVSPTQTLLEYGELAKRSVQKVKDALAAAATVPGQLSVQSCDDNVDFYDRKVEKSSTHQSALIHEAGYSAILIPYDYRHLNETPRTPLHDLNIYDHCFPAISDLESVNKIFFNLAHNTIVKQAITLHGEALSDLGEVPLRSTDFTPSKLREGMEPGSILVPYNVRNESEATIGGMVNLMNEMTKSFQKGPNQIQPLEADGELTMKELLQVPLINVSDVGSFKVKIGAQRLSLLARLQSNSDSLQWVIQWRRRSIAQ